MKNSLRFRELADSIPKAPSDEDIASLLIREAKGEKNGPIKNHAGSINKTYLINTIRHTQSHNTREEIADCWRENEQLNRSKEFQSSKKRSIASSFSEADQISEREMWAARKMAAIAVTSEKPNSTIESASETSEADSELDKKKKSKKSGKNKSKKEKKSKHKAHKRKSKRESNET